LQKQAEQKKIEAEYHRKELLIEQARLAYAKQNAASTTAATITSGNELETSKKKNFFFLIKPVF
jgi:F-type H+-transporting ATP synthase subunit e